MSLVGRRLFNCIEWTELFPRRKTKKVPTSLKQFQKAKQKEKNLGSRDRMREVYHDFSDGGTHEEKQTNKNKNVHNDRRQHRHHHQPAPPPPEKYINTKIDGDTYGERRI